MPYPTESSHAKRIPQTNPLIWAIGWTVDRYLWGHFITGDFQKNVILNDDGAVKHYKCPERIH